MAKVEDLQEHLDAIDGVIARCKSLEVDLKNSRKVESELREKIKFLNKDKNNLEQSILHLESVNEQMSNLANQQFVLDLKSKSEEFKQSKSMLEKKAANYKYRLENSEELNKKLLDDSTSLEEAKRVSQRLEIQFLEERSKLETLTEKHAKLKGEVDLLEKKLKSAEILSQEKVKQNSELYEDVVKMEGEVHKMTFERNAKQREIDSKNRKLDEKIEIIASLKKTLTDAKIRFDKLQESKKDEVSRLEAKVIELEGELTKQRLDFRSQMDKENARIIELQKELTMKTSAHREALQEQRLKFDNAKQTHEELLEKLEQDFLQRKGKHFNDINRIQLNLNKKLELVTRRKIQEENAHRTEWQEYTEKFDQKNQTSMKIIKMLESQILLMQRKFEDAIEKIKGRVRENAVGIGSHHHNKGVPITEYSALLVDLSKKEAAIKVLKRDIKALKPTNPLDFKKTEAGIVKNDGFLSMFEIRASTLWAANAQLLQAELKESRIQLGLARKTAEQFDLELVSLKRENKAMRASINSSNIQSNFTGNRQKTDQERFELTVQNEEDIEVLHKEIFDWRCQHKKLKESIRKKDEIINMLKKQKVDAQNNQYLRRNHSVRSTKNPTFNQSLSKSHQLKGKEKIIKDLRGKLEGLRNAGNELQNAKDTLCDTIRTLSADVERKENIIMNLRKKIKTIEENLVNSPLGNNDKFEKLESKCRTLKSETSRKENILKSTKERMKILSKEIEELKAEKSRSAEKLRSKIRQEKRSSKSLNQILEILHAIIEDLERANQRLRNENQLSSRVTLKSSSKALPEPFLDSNATINGETGVSNSLRDFTTNELRDLMGVEKSQCVRNNETLVDYEVPTVPRPKNMEKNGPIICGYICRLMEERIELEVIKSLRIGRQ